MDREDMVCMDREHTVCKCLRSPRLEAENVRGYVAWLRSACLHEITCKHLTEAQRDLARAEYVTLSERY